MVLKTTFSKHPQIHPAVRCCICAPSTEHHPFHLFVWRLSKKLLKVLPLFHEEKYQNSEKGNYKSKNVVIAFICLFTFPAQREQPFGCAVSATGWLFDVDQTEAVLLITRVVSPAQLVCLNVCSSF